MVQIKKSDLYKFQPVIPAQAGIHCCNEMDSHLRGNDNCKDGFIGNEPCRIFETIQVFLQMSPDLCVIPAQAEIHFEQSVGYPPSRV
jgi:hypothetical protein